MLAAVITSFALGTSAFAWRDNVHRALALFSLQHLTGGYGHPDLDRNLFKTDSIYPLRMHSPAGLGTYLSAFADGCVSQDCEDLFGSGLISLNHFYNPITNSGLTDLAPGFLTTNSMKWAYRGYANFDSWVSARQRYYQALTASTASERTEAAREMFFDLGNVAHLIQDLAQPQHTRNDAHLDESSGGWGIEHFAEAEFGSIAAIKSVNTPSPTGSVRPLIGVYPPGKVVSQIDPSIPVEFQWLWDTNDYTGQPLFESSLTYYDFVLPYNNGLAELTNFFFPTTDTLFSYTNAILLSGGRKVPYFDEAIGSHFPSQRQFRYPKIGESNLIQTLSTQWPWGVDTAISRGTLKPGQPVDTIRLMFPSYLAPNGGYPSVSASWKPFSNLPYSNYISKQGQLFFRDSDYRNICKAVLPYAVDYSSLMVGLFFRGDLVVNLFDPAGYEPYHVLGVENLIGRTADSPLGTLRGGSWELYQTDSAGVRTKRTIPVSEYSGELVYGGGFDLQFFPKPWLGGLHAGVQGADRNGKGGVDCVEFHTGTFRHGRSGQRKQRVCQRDGP